jgi:serralysin
MPDIYGTDGADTLTNNDDVQDFVYLGDGNDIANISNHDWAWGQNGNDYISGGRWENVLHGGNGDDTLLGHGSNDNLTGGMGADLLDGGEGQDWINFGGISGVFVDLTNNVGRHGEAEGDTFKSIEDVSGTDGDDTLFGNDEANGLFGNGGSDYIVGKGGSDHIGGNCGDDTLFGGNGDDTISDGQLSSGNDILHGGAGDDSLNGAGGDDTLTGGEGADIFAFGSHPVWVRVEHSGHDTIQDFDLSVDMIDISYTLASFDELDVTTAAGGTLIDFGDTIGSLFLAGIEPDQLDESHFIATPGNGSTYVTQNPSEEVAFSGNLEIDSLLKGDRFAQQGTDALNITFSFPNEQSVFDPSVYNLDSEPYHGFSPLSDYAQSLFREAFQELTSYTLANFTEVTESGSTVGTIRAGWTTLTPWGGDAAAYTSLNTGSLTSSSDIWFFSENLSEASFSFESTLLHELGHALWLEHPFTGPNTLPTTLDGRDYTVMSYTGSARDPNAGWGDLAPQTFMWLDIQALQYLYGVDTETTAGDEQYDYSLGDRHYLTIWDYGGTDTLSVSGTAETDVHLNLAPGSWSKVGTTIIFSGGATETYTVFITPDTIIENASGGNGNDILWGNDTDNELLGGNGNDTLRGGAGSDYSDGGAGDDQLWAGADDNGNDTLLGGGGDDKLGGGVGDDSLDGGSGSDSLFGGDGNDTLIGGENSSTNEVNRLWSGDGDDVITGAGGDDLIGAKTGDDEIDGGGGDDKIFGAAGNDTIDGGAGDDNLYSGAGIDVVDGGAGNDTLWGGGGDDIFTGGTGADTFIFQSGHGADTVTDFDTDDDILDLSGTATDFTSSADVEAAASDTADGLLIDLGGGNSVTLEGLTVSDIAGMELTL